MPETAGEIRGLARDSFRQSASLRRQSPQWNHPSGIIPVESSQWNHAKCRKLCRELWGVTHACDQRLEPVSPGDAAVSAAVFTGRNNSSARFWASRAALSKFVSCHRRQIDQILHFYLSVWGTQPIRFLGPETAGPRRGTRPLPSHLDGGHDFRPDARKRREYHVALV